MLKLSINQGTSVLPAASILCLLLIVTASDLSRITHLQISQVTLLYLDSFMSYAHIFEYDRIIKTLNSNVQDLKRR